MRFLYVAPRYHTNQMDIMRGLIERGDEVCFISHYTAISEDYRYVKPVVLGYSRLYELWDKFYVNVLKRNDPAAGDFRIQHGFPPICKLYRIIKKYRPDVVILREKSLYSIAVYLMCGKKYPCILYNQTPLWSEPEKKDFAHRLIAKLSPKVRMTPVLGKRSENTSIKKNDYLVPFVMYPQLAPEERTYFEQDTVHILCVAKFEPRKHHLMLLQVVEKLHNRYKLHLTLVGETNMKFRREYYQSVLDYVREHKMESYVTVRSNIPREKMGEVYSAADLFILPSTREMASVSQIEAMSYSLPVICSDTNGTAYYVQDGVTGYQFRDCDEEALLKVTEKMVSDREGMVRMGAEGYRALQEKYSFEKYYESIMQMRELVMSGIG